MDTPIADWLLDDTEQGYQPIDLDGSVLACGTDTWGSLPILRGLASEQLLLPGHWPTTVTLDGEELKLESINSTEATYLGTSCLVVLANA